MKAAAVLAVACGLLASPAWAGPWSVDQWTGSGGEDHLWLKLEPDFVDGLEEPVQLQISCSPDRVLVTVEWLAPADYDRSADRLSRLEDVMGLLRGELDAERDALVVSRLWKVVYVSIDDGLAVRQRWQAMDIATVGPLDPEAFLRAIARSVALVLQIQRGTPGDVAIVRFDTAGLLEALRTAPGPCGMAAGS